MLGPLPKSLSGPVLTGGARRARFSPAIYSADPVIRGHIAKSPLRSGAPAAEFLAGDDLSAGQFHTRQYEAGPILIVLFAVAPGSGAYKRQPPQFEEPGHPTASVPVGPPRDRTCGHRFWERPTA